jgi:hypothetical protein
MSEEDDAIYRRRLSEVLRQHGFDWVVQQAETQIAEGKSGSKQVRELPRAVLGPDFRIGAPKRLRASLITSEPYSEAERLEILLQAIDAAIVQRAKLEETVLDQLSGISSIEFEPDVPSEDFEGAYFGKAHRLDRSRLGSAHDLRERTDNALHRLRGRDRAGA